MGRNFHSVCHDCNVKVMHLRGQESRALHRFSDRHYKHNYQVLDDYVEEPPEDYDDFFDEYYSEPKLGESQPTPKQPKKVKENV